MEDFVILLKTQSNTVYRPISCPLAPTPNICIADSLETTIDTPNYIIEEESTAINNNKHKDTTTVTITKE